MELYIDLEGKESDYKHPIFTFAIIYHKDISPYVIFIDRHSYLQRDGTVMISPAVIDEEVVNKNFHEHIYKFRVRELKDFLQFQFDSFLARSEGGQVPEIFFLYLYKLIQKENYSICPYEDDQNKAIQDWAHGNEYYEDGLWPNELQNAKYVWEKNAKLQEAVASLIHPEPIKASLFTVRPEVLQQLLKMLGGFFKPEEQDELKRIFEEGANSNEKLLFRDNGNRLAYALKQLKETDLLTGCSKKELQRWLIQNFNYRSNKETKAYTEDYAEKTLCRAQWICKNPIFIVKNGNLIQGY